MGLSRLDNFLKSTRGTILYVNPNDIDATDSIENQGNSLTRPFKTIQRALLEAARFSYQSGLNNDRFAQTTIQVYPGEHVIDNRPGFIPDGTNNYRLRNGTTSDNLPAFDLSTNLDLASADNNLFKLNSVNGGVIIPRGTSLVGVDVRKTKIRPKYIPSPTNGNIERSTIFRVTGGCYFGQFSIFDADPNGIVYTDYTSNTSVPNFSHHKLTVFEYADGTNNVSINDAFQTFTADRTDLQMYYEKVSLVYGSSSGRAIEPDYPSTSLDIEPKIDEFRIVGSTGESIGISSIKAGDGTTSTTSITVTTTTAVPGLDVDTPFRISGITAAGYNGQHVVNEKLSSTQIIYKVQSAPTSALPSATGATLALVSDTVTSASPYIFNCSLRSVYGMCGMHADGSKADGFKSMVVAQYTGIGLQKDDNAFVKYNSTTGAWDDSSVAGNEAISTDSRAVYKPTYENFHIKVSNKAVIQAVSIFAIGYAEQFLAESGADIAITNSNSNFGSRALVAKGFRSDAFAQDDVGYITHIIPPKEVPLTETAIEFQSIDVNKTQALTGVGSTGHLFLQGQTNADVKPETVLQGYRIGARTNDTLRVLVSYGTSTTEYTARIVMPDSELSGEKLFTVNRSVAGINSVGTYSAGGTANVITFTGSHSFLNGESIRILSDDGHLPDGITPNTVYFAITEGTGISTNTNIKIAKTLTDAQNNNPVAINEKGGVLKIVSRVSDKVAGDLGHPVQYDSTNAQWYINVSSASTENNIYSTIVGLGSTGLGAATPRAFVNRKSDRRNSSDTLYRARYVIPSSAGGAVARPPTDGFILQESNTSIGSTDAEVQTYFGSGSITNVNQQRNFRFISDATWDGSNVKIFTERPHNLTTDSEVELVNIKSTANTTGTANTGFNRTYQVIGISSAKSFTVGLTTDPGTFSNDTSSRTTSLPYFKKKRLNNTFYVYNHSEVQPYISGEQDGIYYVTLLNSTNSPTISPFTGEKFSQPVKELFPQTNRDNPVGDPAAAKCFASPSLIGDVVVNDVRNSITKETIDKYFRDTDVGVGITNIASTGLAHTITTTIDHGLNRVTSVSIVSGGAGYGSGSAGDLYNARLVAIGDSTPGQHATAKITFDSGGTITSVNIMDGGSAYGVGNTMAVVGVATTSGYSQAVVQVSAIYDNVGDAIRIIGIKSESLQNYNDLYRITGVNIGAATTVTVAAASTITGISTAGIGATNSTGAYFYLTGEALRISALTYNNSGGIATVTTSNRHGLKVNSKVRFTGADQALYNGDFIVKENLSLSSFSVNVGTGTTAPTMSGTMFGYREGYSSTDGALTIDDESLNGRMIPSYTGITTTLAANVDNATTANVSLTDLSSLDVEIGDYLMVDDELVRVKTTNTGTNPLSVFRGVLGTKAAAHDINSVVRRVRVDPVELRRHSINRASGHTFEYVGFGPGNYSTALPQKQNRAISGKEEILSQSTKQDGGVNFFTGMNDKGISFSGNRKLSTLTGVEEIFDTPVQTVTGEDIGNNSSINVVSPLEGRFSRSVIVEGGSDNKATSEFNGPVIFNEKVTSLSSKGVEMDSLFLQGSATVSRKYTVGIATPTTAGNPGDIVFQARPSKGGNSGWIYTTDNDWYRFGTISLSLEDQGLVGLYDAVGIGTTSPNPEGGTTTKLKVGSGTTQFTVDAVGVGIGTTANEYKLHLIGNANVVGYMTASYFVGDGSELTNLNASATGWTQITGGIYDTALGVVGVGTSVPKYNLEVGLVGMGSTAFQVNGDSRFIGLTTAANVFVGGALTALGSYNIENVSSGVIRASSVGIGTTNPVQSFQVGSGTTTLLTITGIGSVGIGTTSPTVDLQVDGHSRFKTYSETVGVATVVSGVVTIDLSNAQSFICTATSAITQFTVSNPPTGSSSFTIKLTQGSSAVAVGIDTFKTSGGADIPVYWPGGLAPIVTPTADATDIYSFKTFDGDNLASVGLYGVVGGQNFS